MVTYPSEGTDLLVTVQPSGSDAIVQQVTIPQGIYPFPLNVTCKACYNQGATITVSVQLLAGSPAFAIQQDTDISFASLNINEDSQQKLPASIYITFSGLTEGDVYVVVAWCASPPARTQRVFKSSSAIFDYFFTALPAHCASSRFITIADSEYVHMAVAE